MAKIQHFRLTGEIDFETDDEGMDDVDAIKVLFEAKLEEGFYDPKTGVTYYMSNGSFDIELDE